MTSNNKKDTEKDKENIQTNTTINEQSDPKEMALIFRPDTTIIDLNTDILTTNPQQECPFKKLTINNKNINNDEDDDDDYCGGNGYGDATILIQTLGSFFIYDDDNDDDGGDDENDVTSSQEYQTIKKFCCYLEDDINQQKRNNNTNNNTNNNNNDESNTDNIIISNLLSITSLLKTEHAPFHPTKIILDWDDTLLPTTWLKDYIDNDPVELLSRRQDLQNLTDELMLFLTLLEQFGSISIITNSQHGWVEYSCRKYIPKVWDTINKYTIISARTSYDMTPVDEEIYLQSEMDKMWYKDLLSESAYVWKFRALSHQIKGHHTQLWGFGDGRHDSAVICDLGKIIKKLDVVKIIQFSLSPNAKQIIQHLIKIRKEIFPTMFHNNNNNVFQLLVPESLFPVSVLSSPTLSDIPILSDVPNPNSF